MENCHEEQQVIDPHFVKKCVLLALLPGVILMFILLGLDYVNYHHSYDNVTEEIDYYTYNGWPIETIKSEFDNEYKHTLIANYFLEPFRKYKVEYYKSSTEQSVDIRKEGVLDELDAKKKEAEDLEIPGIAVDTSMLQKHYGDIYEGLDTENYYEVKTALAEIPELITALQAEQQESIQEQLDQRKNAIDDIVYVGARYGLWLDSYQQQAATIEASSDDPLTKFKDLDAVKQEAAAQLDAKIVSRGGWATSGKRILIVIGEQHLYMIDNYEIVYDMASSTGIQGHETAAGEFQVYDKTDMVWGYYDIWMPYWITIYFSSGLKNGIHGIPLSPDGTRWWFWDDDVGVNPVTYGCVMPHDEDAKIVFDWADIGIPVSIVY